MGNACSLVFVGYFYKANGKIIKPPCPPKEGSKVFKFIRNKLICRVQEPSFGGQGGCI